MKEPKKWNRPRLYWTDSDESYNCQLVIIYPDKTWPERSLTNDGIFGFIWPIYPCWFRPEMEGKPELQRKAMMNYAKRYGFKRYFIGEL